MGKYNVTWQINAEMDHILGMNYFYIPLDLQYLHDLHDFQKKLAANIIAQVLCSLLPATTPIILFLQFWNLDSIFVNL